MRDKVLQVYQALVSDHDDIIIKGQKSAYTALNGNMFSFVDPEGLMCLRLSKEDKNTFERTHGTGEVVQYGAVMRGYVPVPELLLNDPVTMKDLFAKSVVNARTLKPKPTKKS